MLTGKLKNQVDEIWEVFWTGGVTNPHLSDRAVDLSTVYPPFG